MAVSSLVERLGYPLQSLRPGVTEAYFHPAVATSELRAMTPDWEQRVDDHRALAVDGEPADAVARARVELVGYRALRDLMRQAS